jgi:hypothetical protein
VYNKQYSVCKKIRRVQETIRRVQEVGRNGCGTPRRPGWSPAFGAHWPQALLHTDPDAPELPALKSQANLDLNALR